MIPPSLARGIHTGLIYDPAKAKENGDVIIGGSITDSIGVATEIPPFAFMS